MKKKENQRVALTKRLLKETLLVLMEEKNIQNITIVELCNMAEINRSTFYNHYGCPADVLLDIENSVVNDLDEIWTKENETEKNLALDKCFETLCIYISEHRKLFQLLFRNDDTTSDFAVLLMNAAHVKTIYDQISSYTKNKDKKKLITTFLTNGAYYMIRQWILEDIPMSPKEMGELVYFITTQG